jgi:hypothetical protein
MMKYFINILLFCLAGQVFGQVNYESPNIRLPRNLSAIHVGRVEAGGVDLNTPLLLTITTSTDSTVNLTWTDVNSDIDGFKIYRSIDDVTYSLLATVTDTTYTDSGLPQSSLYFYKVKAYDGSTLSSYSNLKHGYTEAAVIRASGTMGWFDYSYTPSLVMHNDSISEWSDKLGSAHDLLQATTTKQPILRLTSPDWNYNGVVFNGTDDFLKATNFTYNQPSYVYFVFNNLVTLSGKVAFDGSVYNRGMLCKTTGGRNNFIDIAAGTLSPNSDQLEYRTTGIIRALFNGASSKFIVNEATPITGNFGTNAQGGITIGSDGSGANRWSNIVVKEAIFRNSVDTVGTPDNDVNIYNYLKNKYLWFVNLHPEDTVTLNATSVSAGVDDAMFRIAGHTDSIPLYVNWGDGIYSYPRMNGVLDTLTHIYTSAGTYKIIIGNASSMQEFNVMAIDDGEDRVWADVSDWEKATRLERFAATNTSGIHTWTGNVSILPVTMTDWYLGFNTDFTGDMTKFVNTIVFEMASHATATSDVYGNTSGWTKCKRYNPFGSNNFTGDMSACLALENVFVGGNSENTINVTNLINLKSLEKGFGAGTDADTSAAYFNGSLAGHEHLGETTYFTWPYTGLKKGWVCVNAPNDLEGDLTGLDSLVYLSCTGNGHFSGNVDGPGQSGRLYAFYLNGGIGHHTVTGNPMSWPNLQDLMGTASLTKMTRFNNNPAMQVFTPGGLNAWIYSASEVNQLLADLWANKDEPKLEDSRTDRLIDLRLSAAPTGQGITDRDALRLYRSPNNDAGEPLWTVLTQ